MIMNSSIISRIGISVFCLWQLSLAQDSSKVQYAIIGMSFYGDYDVVKIKVPPWLLTSEVMEQIKLSILGPSSALPEKMTYVYVFKETDQVGDTSSTGAVYLPGKGFSWSLSRWSAQNFPNQIPTEKDLEIYYTLIDQIVKNGSTLDNLRIRKQVSRQYSITVSELDSIYSWVKYWLALQQNTRK